MPASDRKAAVGRDDFTAVLFALHLSASLPALCNGAFYAGAVIDLLDKSGFIDRGDFSMAVNFVNFQDFHSSTNAAWPPASPA